MQLMASKRCRRGYAPRKRRILVAIVISRRKPQKNDEATTVVDDHQPKTELLFRGMHIYTEVTWWQVKTT